METHRLGVKLFAREPCALQLPALIPVFHSWIQEDALEDHLMVDVHDYGHVSKGPGILLVAHEGIFSWDLAAGRPGLLYQRKQPLAGTLEERLESVFGVALRAARLLETDPSLRLGFRTDEMLVMASDRLQAPNTDSSFQGFRPGLEALLDRLLGGRTYRLVHQRDPQERFAVLIRSPAAHGVETLLGRIQDARDQLIV